MHPLKIQVLDVPCENSKIIAPDLAIGVAHEMSPVNVLRESVKSGIRQIVQDTNADLDRAVETARVMIEHPNTFLDFPISSIFRPSQAGPEAERQLTVFNFDFDRASQKVEMLGKLDEYLESIMNRSARYDLCLIADELVSNACYNAPYPKGGAQTNDVSRNDPTVLETALRPGSMFLGMDGKQVVIVCRDQYGTLDLRGLLNRLVNCLENGASKSMNMAGGGAGLGSMIVYNACSSYYVGIDHNVRTVVAATMSVKSQKHHADKHKTLHLFSK